METVRPRRQRDVQPIVYQDLRPKTMGDTNRFSGEIYKLPRHQILLANLDQAASSARSTPDRFELKSAQIILPQYPAIRSSAEGHSVADQIENRSLEGIHRLHLWHQPRPRCRISPILEGKRLPAVRQGHRLADGN